MFLVRYALSPREILSTKEILSHPSEFRNGLVFVGNGVNPTNIVAIRWFLDFIFAQFLELFPSQKLIIIGND